MQSSSNLDKKIKLNPPTSGFYNDEDVQDYVRTLNEENARPERIARTDLTYGNIVIVLEGEFAAKRVVYLGRGSDFTAICIGPKALNGAPLFKIDERFVLKTSTVLNLKKVEIKDEEKIFLSKRDFESIGEFETTQQETEIEKNIIEEAKKTKFMTTYIKTQFDVRENEDILFSKF